MVTAEPPDPLIGATVECVDAGGGDDEEEAGGVLAGGVDDVVVLCVTVAALWAGLLLVFLAA